MGERKMIFVTVGTHEQPFNRLISKIDDLKRDGIIADHTIIQTGFSDYEPKYCEWKKLYTYAEINELVDKANIVVTHGGPSSFIMALQHQKIPLVVPRQKKYNEHVNDHQVEFCKKVQERYGNIIVVDDTDKIGDYITNYGSYISNMNSELKSNNESFCEELSRIVDDLLNN